MTADQPFEGPQPFGGSPDPGPYFGPPPGAPFSADDRPVDGELPASVARTRPPWRWGAVIATLAAMTGLIGYLVSSTVAPAAAGANANRASLAGTSGSPGAGSNSNAAATPAGPGGGFFGGGASAGGAPAAASPVFGGGGLGGSGTTITAVGPTSLTIATANGTVTITTNASTTYTRDGAKVDRSALAAGEQVVVRIMRPAQSASSTSTHVASFIDIVSPRIEGTVVNMSSGTITISDSQGFWRTIHTNGQTTYAMGGKAESSSAVGMGDNVEAVGTIDADHTDLDARTVTVVLPTVSGRVSSVSGGTISVTGFDGSTITVHTSSSTSVTTGRNTSASISSVAKNDFIVAQGTRNSDGSLQATTVRVVAVMGGGGSGPGGQGGPGPFGGRGGRGGFGFGPPSGGGATPGYGGSSSGSGSSAGSTS